MSNRIDFIWQEILADIGTPVAGWQIGVIVMACAIAWMINGAIRAYVMSHAPESWKIGIGTFNRLLFPLSTLSIVLFSKWVLGHWQHTTMLHLASNLLLAMAAVRLVVYAMRYIIAPGGVLKTIEHTLATMIWLVLALHLSGILPEMLETLEAVKFKIGKNPVNLLLLLQGLLTILITVFVAMWLSRVIENKLMQVAQLNANTRVMLAKVVRICLLFIAVLIGLSAVGLDLTLISVFGGALGVGLGFGLQRIASNYVSGFILLMDKSISIGDIVTIDVHYGIIKDLRTRYLVLKKLDGTEVIIPNETLIINPVINHSGMDRNTRVQVAVQVGYESDLELVLQLLIKAAEDHPRVLVTPAPGSVVTGFAESGIDVRLTVWIHDAEEGTSSLQSDLFMAIWRLFKAHDISIPYPQREVRLLGA
ncbi:mechanosensitive ion channel protein MscS [Methylotenera oryzisoli]|jgi:small-conductance mechanosensitive channel|uniref:Mechanosensitive ion channel protein MscS n=1 Tax=Methylotenera oryzisoli TaxID=2080758 RepID=A0A4Y9VQH4_9PROT|nr:mechanosensitive ion channel domain-containing protein [Methylotenera oryzisoli]TFW71201.1 mechanosensitive ion channel protein MscS [Methylotenera oryzisoli]